MENGLGLRLENLQEKYGYSQKEISKLLGYTDNVFGQYVRGNRTPDYETLIKLSDLFHVSLDYLLRGKEFQHDEAYATELKKLTELLNLFKEAGIDHPYVLDLERWQQLTSEKLKELTYHFEYVVHKRIQDKNF